MRQLRSCGALKTTSIANETVAEWSSPPTLKFSHAAKTTPHLPIDETPDFALPPLAEWASVAEFGGKPIVGKKDVPDCGPALQKVTNFHAAS